MAAAYPMPLIDPVAVIESSFHSMFLEIFNNESVSDYFGFWRISPFHSADGMPGWYLWFQEKPGVYGLFVEDAVCLSGDKKSDKPPSTVAGRIRIMYYPDAEEEVFETFSWFEKIALMGSFFDSTGTPTAEGRQQLDVSFFTVGHMDSLMTVDGSLLEFVCTAPQTWVDLRPEGLVLKDPEGRPFQALQPGERDRDVPGWRLSRFLFDKIVSGFCFCRKCAPTQADVYEFDMPEFSVDAKARVWESFALALSGYQLQVVFSPASGLTGDSREIYQEMNWCRQLPGGTLNSQMPGRWLHAWSGKGREFSNPEGLDWWKIKDLHFHDHGGRLCTCYEDH